MPKPQTSTRDIDYTETEYGVCLTDDGYIAICNDEEDARLTAAMCADAQVVSREVYFGAWGDA